MTIFDVEGSKQNKHDLQVFVGFAYFNIPQMPRRQYMKYVFLITHEMLWLTSYLVFCSLLLPWTANIWCKFTPSPIKQQL